MMLVLGVGGDDDIGMGVCDGDAAEELSLRGSNTMRMSSNNIFLIICSSSFIPRSCIPSFHLFSFGVFTSSCFAISPLSLIFCSCFSRLYVPSPPPSSSVSPAP